ncbi:MAG: hypothetical protein QOI77_1623 [Blastocatellia bacterium]|nr:hypothetical protein [Blastocatellia bacterium]
MIQVVVKIDAVPPPGVFCRQHPDVVDVRRITVPGHLQIVFDPQGLHSFRADNQGAPSGVTRQFDGKQLRDVRNAFARRSRGKRDRCAPVQPLRRVLQIRQQQLQVVPPLPIAANARQGYFVSVYLLLKLHSLSSRSNSPVEPSGYSRSRLFALCCVPLTGGYFQALSPVRPPR